jgi:hypothetical protein
MRFSFNLLRICGLYMFRALLAHPQEVLHKRHLLYCVRIMSVGCGSLQPCHSQLTYAHSIPNAVCGSPPEDEQVRVMLETCRGLRFSINWMKSASRWFHYTEIWRRWQSLFQLFCEVASGFKASVKHVLEASPARSDGTHNTHTYSEVIISPFSVLESRLIENWWLTIEPSNR